MNSKEALRIIRDELKYVIDDLDTYDRKVDNAYKQIKKDLEVLEILKYLIHSIERTFNLKEFNPSGMMGTHVKDYFIDNDITGKIKEWLENDKN